jgi:hypothetical protein
MGKVIAPAVGTAVPKYIPSPQHAHVRPLRFASNGTFSAVKAVKGVAL